MLYFKTQDVIKNFFKILKYILDLLLNNSTTIKKFTYNFTLFAREGFYIDALQKNSLNTLSLNLLVTSTQFFNINFLNYKFIKVFIDDLYKPLNYIFGDINEISIANSLRYLIVSSILFLQLILITYLYISFLISYVRIFFNYISIDNIIMFICSSYRKETISSRSKKVRS